MHIEVRLYATLRRLAPAAPAGVFSVALPAGCNVAQLLDNIKVNPAEVHMLMVNGAGSTPDRVLNDGDRVGLFPPVGGG